jgi:hypothetical protein
MGRAMTVQELADGLTQEYGSETTSYGAIQRLESLSMGVGGLDTLAAYNQQFNQYYNQVSTEHQVIATRAYVKGLLPEYLKYIVLSEDNLSNMSAARAAATRAMAKHDMVTLATSNHEIQKARATNQRKPATESISPAVDSYRDGNTRVNLNVMGEPDHGEGNAVEAQLAAASSRFSSRPERKEGFRLSSKQRTQLYSENRCFNCHKVGHIKDDCRSKAATTAPQPLN